MTDVRLTIVLRCCAEAKAERPLHGDTADRIAREVLEEHFPPGAKGAREAEWQVYLELCAEERRRGVSQP